MLQSRKFRALCFDIVLSLVLYFAAKYASPSLGEDIKMVILALQPVFVTYILGTAYVDGQANQSVAQHTAWLDHEERKAANSEPGDPPQ